ncbi:MAG: ammonium transporter [Planctomycetes bacterium]|nr:ammonium transporter [Planctomycetota bacterium]
MDPKVIADTLWVLVTAMLVFFMNLGFACVETGLCRSKNAVNILSKNFIVFAAASISFLLLGFGLMFGNGNGFLGWDGLWFLGGADNSPAMGDKYQGAYSALSWTGVPLLAKFFFQLVFCGTAATIVSGAVAERIKYYPFIVFSFIICGIIYPIVGHWIWGGGWLATQGFRDFAGSTQVHSIGGWAALAGVLVLGPRLGKFNKDGTANVIPGHNMSLALIGGFVLWLGWFGFNPGSTMAADVDAISRICITTNTAAAAAMLSATLTSTLLLKKPDLSMAINGCLAGLVAITAPCAFVSVGSSLIIGLGAGVLVVLSVLAFDKVKVDDPVGALSVHLVNGVYGTLCVGLFCEERFIDTKVNGLFFGGGMTQVLLQLYGIGAAAVTVFGLSLVAWLAIKAVMGLRVSAQEELDGLDVYEHGSTCYPEFAARTIPLSLGAQLGETEPAPELSAKPSLQRH